MIETYESPALRMLFKGLVEKAGKAASVCAVIKQETGRDLQPSTLTKIGDGSMRFDWNLAFQIEDIAGSYPITAMLNARRSEACGKTEFDRLAEDAVRELSEVPLAVFHSIATGQFDELQKEGGEGLAALQSLLDHVKAKEAAQ